MVSGVIAVGHCRKSGRRAYIQLHAFDHDALVVTLWTCYGALQIVVLLLLLLFIPSVVKIPRVKNKVKNSVWS